MNKINKLIIKSIHRPSIGKHNHLLARHQLEWTTLCEPHLQRMVIVRGFIQRQKMGHQKSIYKEEFATKVWLTFLGVGILYSLINVEFIWKRWAPLKVQEFMKEHNVYRAIYSAVIGDDVFRRKELEAQLDDPNNYKKE